jgi:hypothetical protein
MVSRTIYKVLSTGFALIWGEKIVQKSQFLINREKRAYHRVVYPYANARPRRRITQTRRQGSALLWLVKESLFRLRGG